MLRVKVVFRCIVFVMLVILQPPIFAQSSDGDSILRIDSAIRCGMLSNGFSYFIRKNTDPADAISIHLVVKAGYEQEADDQLELSHLLEHMAFVSTENFADPYAFLESRGIARGENINAHTGYNSTSYDLEIPSGDDPLLGYSLKFLRDCAHGILLNSQEVDVQRNPVIRELSTKANYLSDMEHEYLKKLYRNPSEKSTYERIESLRTFKKEKLIEFYQDWYRPDLQAIIVVGNVDVADIEKRIRSIFDDLKNPVSPKSITLFENKNDPGVSDVVVVTHDKMDQLKFSLSFNYPYEVVNTIGEFEKTIVFRLFNSMIKRRLSSINIPGSDSTISTIRIAFGDRHLVGSDFFNLSLQSTMSFKHVEQGFKNSVRQLKDVWEFGFTSGEFDRAKLELLKSENELDESSRAMASAIVQYFVRGDVVLTKAQREMLVNRMFREFSVHDLNRNVKELIAKANPDIVLFAPEMMKSRLPTPENIKTWFEEVKHENSSQRLQDSPGSSLMRDTLLCSRDRSNIISLEYVKESRVVSIRLLNGMNVYIRIKSKRSEGDLMYIHGFRSLDNPINREYNAFQIKAASLVAQSGLGNLDHVELSKSMVERSAGVWPFFGKNGAELSGCVSEEDGEYLFQVMHLYLNDARIDANVFSEAIQNATVAGGSRVKTANEILGEEISKQQGNWENVVSNERILAMGRDTLLRIFNKAFQCSDNFNFVISSVTDSINAIHFVDKYFGCIRPANRSNSDFDTNGVVKQKYSNVKKTVRGSKEGSALITLIYTDEGPYDYKRYLEARLLARVLQNRLLYVLRDVHGATYNVSVRCNSYEYPASKISIAIGFECDDKQYEQMIEYVNDEISSIKVGRLSSKDFNAALAIEEQAIADDLSADRFWLTYLVNQIQIDKHNLNEVLSWIPQLRRLRSSDVKMTAKRCLVKGNLSSFVVLPAAGT